MARILIGSGQPLISERVKPGEAQAEADHAGLGDVSKHLLQRSRASPEMTAAESAATTIRNRISVAVARSPPTNTPCLVKGSEKTSSSKAVFAHASIVRAQSARGVKAVMSPPVTMWSPALSQAWASSGAGPL